ncbi:MAG: hypothetical protein KatS3mg131_0400 [Candidatus Tectimicrobiota bacterium]|nr:MAG: hypothetical protein KatS3mg131_0400 [Candidatus Tectomicrobia bacterium]
MQSLRDQLLKAGLITTEQLQRVEREGHSRRSPRQREARHAAAPAAAPLRAQELPSAEERDLQVRYIVDYWALPEEESASRRWYFPTRHHTIWHLYVSEQTARRLDAGEVAIVERPGPPEPRYVLVEGEAVPYIARLEPAYIRFFNGRF